MARKTTRALMAAAAAAAVLLTACGQPVQQPTAAEPAPVTSTAPEPAAVEPTPTVEPTPEPTPEAELSPSPTPEPSRTPTAAPTTRQAGKAIMQQGNQSERVKELQARLAQIGWFSGKVTGNYGSETRTAVAGFQRKRGLPETGAVDQATWDRLVGMTRKPTADELSGKPKPTPTRTTSQPAANNGNSGDRKAQGLDPRCMTGRVICISKKSNKVWWVNDGVVKMTMDARFGTSEFRTREGTFSVQWKSRDHVSNLYHTSMPYALFFSGGQAVHYSPDFAARGYNGGSHGCVNLRSRSGAESLFNQARVGDKVVVYS